MMTNDLRYNSGYLAHLGALAHEAAQRARGVPPFQLLIAVALFVHIAIIAPVYLMDLADDMPEVTQVRVAFGVDTSRDVPTRIVAPASAQPSDEIVSNLDALFQPKQQAKKTVRRNPRSTSTAPSTKRVNAPPVVARPNVRHTQPTYARRTGNAANPARPQPAAQRSGGQGGTANVREVVSKYERLLSGWIDRHKIYPDEAYRSGVQGQVVVRIRINRRGAVAYKIIERSSGNALLDAAVLETVTRAAPMPTVPSEYPGGAQLEFLIPIQFRI